MNNKGQALITFVLLLPIIILIMAIVIDLGNILIIKEDYTSNIKDVIEYGLEYEGDDLEERLQTLLDNNIEGTYTISITDNTIEVNIKETKQGLYSNIIDDTYTIDLTYIGYKDTKEIKKVH